MVRESSLITCRKTKSIQLECAIDLTKLFAVYKEIKKFEASWPKFLCSEQYRELTNQLTWAHSQADRLDPLTESLPSILDEKDEDGYN